MAYFPRTDPGQFMINLKAPTGTRLEVTEELVEAESRPSSARRSRREELDVIVANIGVQPGFSSIYTSNSGQHTATVQVSLNDGHRHRQLRIHGARAAAAAPGTAPVERLFPVRRPGGRGASIWACPRPSTSRSAAPTWKPPTRRATKLPQKIARLARRERRAGAAGHRLPGAAAGGRSRSRASQLGLSSKEVVHNVITALTSNQMIAPSYWVDPETGNDYMLTVQYPEGRVQDLD